MRNNKQCYLLVLLLLFGLLGVTPAFALHGGPDAYGYRYIDSLDKAGPDFAMERVPASVVIKDGIEVEEIISLVGKSHIGDSSLVGPIPIGFPFEFYGKTYTNLYISGNGYLVFYMPLSINKGEYISYPYAGQKVPSSDPPNNFLAPFWSYNVGSA